MPFLDLPQLHLPESGPYILAVMVSPDDPIAQKTFMASQKGQVILNVLNKYEPQELAGLPQVTELAIETANAPRLQETTRQLVPAAMRGGPLAAKTLLLVLSLAAHVPLQASLGNALRCCQVQLKGRRGGSTANLKKAWKRFAPVSHLWAAFDIGQELWMEAGSTGNGSKLAEWLALAEAFRLKGERWTPYRADGPLLDPARTWKVPDTFLLPKCEFEMPLPPPDLLSMAGVNAH